MTTTFYTIKAGAFYLSRWPEVKGQPQAFGGDLYDTHDQAALALAEMIGKKRPHEAAILRSARIVRLDVTESES